MSLRDRLAHKARRRITVPVAVSDATGAATAAQQFRVQENLARLRDRTEEADALAAQAEEKEAEVSAAHELLEFQAADPADFERIQSTYFQGRDDEPVDVNSALPELLAMCAVEEELQDSEWWAAQFKEGVWSFGERNELWRRLLNLNSQAPDPKIPFA